MNSYRPTPSSSLWVTACKIVILLVALYFSSIVLGHVFSWVLTIAFVLIRVAVFIVVGFFLLHFFLKLLFRFDLWNFVLSSRFRR
ncbi:hypothetical protein [Desulfitobacterium sp.]|uniref:hypothetical protein n=1 Tax=Desulfitobacterium sp. TaxID=49981 RepID=UPI002BC6673E|nr:hypothetical protein [Desulfitobacterium sp.]HVJ50347.1 hypothetical protein [Desulfitobacterium sp.]